MLYISETEKVTFI